MSQHGVRWWPHLNKSFLTARLDLPMRYNPNRDLVWLILRPWVWVPRLFQIIISLLLLSLRLIIYGSSPEAKIQKDLARRLLTTLTDLGPCFIKVGQALSTRPDLIRRDWLDELTNLQDNLPPFSHEKARRILEEELGSTTDELFREFPDESIASASLGQVYKVKLFDNSWVAVKVQRPNLEFIIRRDLVLIKFLAILSAPILPLNLGFGLGEIVDEFGKSLFEEIDYENEAKNAEKFAGLFKDNPAITIPKVKHEFSSAKIITTSWIQGTKLKDRKELEDENLDTTLLIRTGVISGIQQLLEYGYFHADPHPGNMFALNGSTDGMGHLAYVDFGMMDSISDKDRTTLTEAIVNLINKDFNSLAKNFQKLGFLSKKLDITPLEPVLEQVLGGSLGEEVGSFNFKEITNRFSELMFDYPFRVPARFALIIRAVVSQEGLALRLDPKFKILNVAYPYVAKRLLTDSTKDMLDILLKVIFDENGSIRIERIESLLEVLVKDSVNPGPELIPVAGAGLKLLLSSKGNSIRKSLLLNIIKDDKISTVEIKNLLKIIRRNFGPVKLAGGFARRFNPLAA